MHASFHEKSAWITLAALLLVFTGYFFVAGNMLLAGVTASVVPFIPVFSIATVLLVGVLTCGHLIAAVLRAPEVLDERDRWIACRAESRSSWILGVGVLVAVFGLAAPVGPAWIANGLLASLFLAEVTKLSIQVWHYRRGS